MQKAKSTAWGYFFLEVIYLIKGSVLLSKYFAFIIDKRSYLEGVAGHSQVFNPAILVYVMNVLAQFENVPVFRLFLNTPFLQGFYKVTGAAIHNRNFNTIYLHQAVIYL